MANYIIEGHAYFDDNFVTIMCPYKKPIVKETEKCFFVKDTGGRYLKSEMGKPILKYASSYPYISVYMVDATPEDILTRIAEWHRARADMLQNSFIRKEVKEAFAE